MTKREPRRASRRKRALSFIVATSVLAAAGCFDLHHTDEPGATGGAGADGTGGTVGGGTGGSSAGTGGRANAGTGGVSAGTGGALASTGGNRGTGGSGARRMAITPDATGWVAGATNDVGVQGQWFPYTGAYEPATAKSTITMTASATGVCVVASVHRTDDVNGDGVLDANDYNVYWGVGFALQLNNQNGQELPWDAQAAGVSGFQWQLSGTSVPAKLDIAYASAGGLEYCERIDAGFGTYAFNWLDARRSCFDATPIPGAPDPRNLYRFRFIIPSYPAPEWPSEYMSFNFCINNLTARP